jgi:UDP-N-acetyl-2-amino-2-deoxyglucuronate dehydrogenase
VNELQVYTPDPGVCAPSSEDFSGNVYGYGHVKVYADLVAFFRQGDPYPVTYEDTLATIRLLNSFYVADEIGMWVDVATAGDSARLGRTNEQLANLYRTPAPVSA